MPGSASDLIDAFNAGREAERLKLKREKMRKDVFGFFRGTAHLFWQRVRETGTDASAPPAWSSGDLHIENFGTYLGDNGLAYFDVNDFDEAAKAPCDWEMLRLAASVAVAGPELGLAVENTARLIADAAETYRATLAAGKVRWIERNTATGPIGELIDGLKSRTREKLLDKRTTRSKQRRKLYVPSDRALPATSDDLKRIERFCETLPQLIPEVKSDGYFTFVDGARRIAGNGSLGLQRFVLLVEGEGSPDGNALLDLKQVVPSSLAVQCRTPQPNWTSDAVRVAMSQSRCQAVAPNLLHAVTFGGLPFVIKELQPSEDRLDLSKIAKREELLQDVLRSMSRIAAWAQLRSAARDGASTPDELMAFARGAATFASRLTDAAQTLAKVTRDDYASYCATYDAK